MKKRKRKDWTYKECRWFET